MFLVLLSLFALGSTPADANRISPDSLILLPEVTVTASRVPARRAHAPARVLFLDRDDLRASGARSAAAALASRSTAFIRSYGTGLATISLRGSSPGHTLVLIDGIRLSEPQTGQIDVSLLPTILFQGVEVLHGAASALYGSDGIAGVINLQTERPNPRPSTTLSAFAGAFGERGVGMRSTVTPGDWRVIAAAEVSSADGDFAVPADVALRENARRSGSDRRYATVYASAHRTGAVHDLQLNFWAAAAERGLPGPVTTRPIGERQWDRHVRFWIADALDRPNYRLNVSGGIHAAEVRYVNPQLQLDDAGWAAGPFAEASMTATRGYVSWTVGSQLDANRADHPSRRDAWMGHGAMFAAASIGNERVLVFPALRWDGYAAPASTVRQSVTPRVGTSIRLTQDGRARLKASMGRAFRSPTFNERFWKPGGDPDLQAERAWQADIGLAYGGRWSAAELSLFAARTENEIMWLPDSRGIYEAKNLRRTRNLGVELSADVNRRISWNGFATGGLLVTLTHATDRSDRTRRSFGSPLRYVPALQVKAHGSLAMGPAALDLQSRYVGRRYVTVDGSQWVNPFFVTDLQLRVAARPATSRATLAIGVHNLFNAQYAVIQHYPMPPRHLRFTLTIDLEP